MKTNETPRPISSLIEEEFVTHKDDDTEELYWTKSALSKMTRFQRKIYITFLELGSYTKAARAYRVCPATMKAYITQLTDQILKYVCDNMAGPTSTDAGDEKA